MLTETKLETIADELARRFAGREYGSIQILDATAEVITDVNDLMAVQLNLVLEDPTGETWPIDDMLDLRRAARTEVMTFPEPFMVHFEIQPRTEPDQDEPDDEV